MTRIRRTAGLFWCLKPSHRALGVAAAILILAGSISPSHGGDIEQIRSGSLTPEARVSLNCPANSDSGRYSKPLVVAPSPELIVSATYSDDLDIVHLDGNTAPIYSDLGAGDDFVFLDRIGAGWNITGGAGADTILLCSMDDLSASIQLGTWAGDSDPDLVIIESPVFESVAAGMLRNILIFEYNPAYDRLVIRARTALLETRQSSIELGGIRVGNVIIKIYTPPAANRLQLGGQDVASVTFVPMEIEN